MSMPSDVTPDITEAMEAEARFPGERLVSQFTPQQRGWAATALIVFIGVAYLGPMVGRLTQPKSRTQQIRDEMAWRTRAARKRARAVSARVQKTARKKARRLGGGTIWR